ncbi:transferrin receptor ectodomain, apical domain-containing protein [Pilatotrama ljubarskyi]|nr:transferrin receptor ectodomain, apical domain-containing protein [Pilatotrama ljubarskyi]
MPVQVTARPLSRRVSSRVPKMRLELAYFTLTRRRRWRSYTPPYLTPPVHAPPRGEELGIPPPPEAPVFSAGSAASREATLAIGRLTKPNAWIDTYYPLMNTPLHRSLSILDEGGSALWEAELEEDGDPRDPDAAKHKDAVPVFHGYSADGEVEGPLIYVNYGSKEDYDAVLAAGGNFTGKIVLARYGANARGLKVLAAEEVGAVGVLMYSDTRDDGPVTVENGYDPYPAGPARNPHSVQRGSVQYLSLYPGDPTTPGVPAYPNATRTEGGNIPKIPSLPISWANAQRLLKEISQKGLEDAFELDGKTSKRNVRLVNHVHNRIMPIWSAMAVIPGHIHNETVIVGNHRDVGMPKRLSYIDRYGLIGSTEWAEDFPEWISGNVVAYINVDGSAAGSPWIPTGSPSLVHLIRNAALDVAHPTDPNRTLWDARNDIGPFRGPANGSEFLEAYKAKRRAQEDDVGIAPLGSGSDFTPFLQRLGVASMDETFNLSPTDAAYHYHSIYDTEMWKEKYADPGFDKHLSRRPGRMPVTVAKHLGLVMLRLADSTILPLNTTHYALDLTKYLASVKETASALGFSVDFSNLSHKVQALLLASRILDVEKADAERALRDALRELPGHGRKPRGLLGWLKRLLDLLPGLPWHGRARREFERALQRVQKANAKLIGFERGCISEEGLEGREWYRHLGVAPGKWLGYGATTLPAITEALTIARNATLAESEAGRLAGLLDELARSMVA